MSRQTFVLGLAGVALAFLALAWMRYDPEGFGAAHDDTLYFSAAKSIAEGRGSRMASIPGEPPQTKYPGLYPVLLSLVWKLNPDFPANLKLAWGLNALFAALAVVAAGGLARQLGASRGEALALAAVMGSHPAFVLWSNLLVSDLVFMAFALSAAVLADRELRRENANWGAWAGVIVLLTLACWTRTVGAAFVAGVSVAALLRRAPVKGLAALAGAAPVAWGLLAGRAGEHAPTGGQPLPGFEQNLSYYSSYVEHWRQSVPSWDVFGAQVQMVLTELLKHAAVEVFHLPALGFVSMPLALIAIAISVGVVNGIVSRAREHGIHPVHIAALVYLPIVLLWNYLLMSRLWLPFLPLFLAGASHELQRIAGMARHTWRKSAAGERVVVAGFASALVFLVGFAVYQDFWRRPADQARWMRSRRELAAPKKEAYQWLRAHSSPADAVISYDDGALYLYAGRQGMRAFSPLTDSFFAQDESRLERDLNGLTDTAAALSARYWVTAPDDFELTHAPEQIRERMEKELAEAPVVFESADGRVRIHDVSAMPWSGDASLRSGDTVRGLR